MSAKPAKPAKPAKAAKKPTVLCILDGWGLRVETHGNAVAQAKTTCFDRLMKTCPHATLFTYGSYVGLPDGQMGNSEVGHMNIGAGRIVEMDLPRINNAIADGRFASLPAMVRFIEKMHQTNGRAHLCGVLSDGGVHCHIDHIIEIANILNAANISVALHLFSDGRDVAPKSALHYYEYLNARIGGLTQVSTVSGRYFSMDRDNRWDRVKSAYHAIMHGDGVSVPTPHAAIQTAYSKDVFDEFIPPSVIGNYTGMNDGDGLIFANFRADRARQILAALCDPYFSAFDTSQKARFAQAMGMVEYSDRHNTYLECLFPAIELKNTLGAWLEIHNKRQFRIAETEKYPHVTFFLNGGVETPAKGEERYMAPSPGVATYDLQPEMAIKEVSDHLLKAIAMGDYDLIVVNFANPDMVGHTGNLSAAIKACESVDNSLARLEEAVLKADGAMIICADHGNCETMIDPQTGGAHTAHTTNLVPMILVANNLDVKLRQNGCLADLAPTLLNLMDMPVPDEMTGQSLIV